MGRDIRLDLDGLEQVASSPKVRAAVDALAEEIAANVEAQGLTVNGRDGERVPLPVTVLRSQPTTRLRVNRARAVVSLAHPAGVAVQAKYGALTRAAAAVGVKVEE